MIINVAQIRRDENGTAHFDLNEDFSAFESELEGITFVAPVHVQLQVNNTGDSLLVQGTIDAEVNAQCGRCLEPFHYTIHQDYEDEWVYAPQAMEEQMETVLVFEKDEIELSERILEQIVLALPMRFICSSECKGLCPVCGVNHNLQSCDCVQDQVDPRLAALASWPRED
ncbi:MAG: DUF177 domain-containing protein [Desulfitobacterium sp.]